ncbi:bifunctional protein HldE [Actinoplanes sp. OR16]|uniref:PfkB family carbohydrate kinase n=1 Tax=Actinoplanes sp. OR16 TaxID=946334 RepID=UPI000F6F2268|nr:PfkB family carbohydrate kinase [Actinoplanes sp. OR16]BBH70848.1 bifunctional protein HldE [Actinoplanes sp. OR16]
MRLVIVGDALLDRDVDGSVRRIAPDAPAPVLDEESSRERPGGAGLAALLALDSGYDVSLVTAIAADEAGARLTRLLTDAGVVVHPLPLPGATPEKIRLRAAGQVLLRLDRGGPPEPPGDVPIAVLDLVRDADAILVSDYGRGVARHPVLRAALEEAKAPVVWDPHPNGPPPVPNVRLVTPNESEALRLSGDAGKGSGLSSAQRAGHALRQRWRAGAVVVTRGAHGAVLCHSGPTPLVVPPSRVGDGDTCGAGDSFAAAAAVALAGGALVSEAVQQAVEAASSYVSAGAHARLFTTSRPGKSPASTPSAQTPPASTPPASTPPASTPSDLGDKSDKSDMGNGVGLAGVRDSDDVVGVGVGDAGDLVGRVRAEGGTVVATGGCFDLLHTGHLATLRAARSLGDCLVVCLNSDDSVRRLKGPERPLNSQVDRARLLAALDCVDAVVIFDEPTPESVLAWLRPDVWVKGGDYADGGPELPEAELMKRWGGQTVIVPYLNGRSTTQTIAAARSGGQ